MSAIELLFAVTLLISGSGVKSSSDFPQTGSPGIAATPVKQSKKTVDGCADFLAQLRKKPAHVEYVRCRYMPERQGKPLQAMYRVSGQYAALAEAHLIRAAGLNRLRHSCCQWDSPAGQFKDARGQEYSINMVSDESMIGSRAMWPKIKTFEITVERLTEEI